ncbi:LOW QUALITY PROTEIN: chromobox protein homolog 5 [Glossina fuscipes]|uniref:LOW QUALITY PROTEIN: chromobox protein homolog 5 n=1 Tax=Glossina fuscipes TaxID=7396 RepID=A0A9C5ZNN6_9MUSC|nr:LOW QUALITY PROTEIN: chromobox protein homolog 5 [Glossina fuscipes]
MPWLGEEKLNSNFTFKRNSSHLENVEMINDGGLTALPPATPNNDYEMSNNIFRHHNAINSQDTTKINIKDGGKDRQRKTSAEEDQEYEVEEIVGHKMVRGVFHFLMRWKGYSKDDDTWEPEYALNCPIILEKYKRKYRLNLTKHRQAPLKKPKLIAQTFQSNLKKIRMNRTVDKIIDYTEARSGRIFRVRWKGLAAKDDTWESENDLTCAYAIQKFMKRIKSQEKDLNEKPTKRNKLHMDD